MNGTSYAKQRRILITGNRDYVYLKYDTYDANMQSIRVKICTDMHKKMEKYISMYTP